jgi:GNAT superfamily N-acetyltransferase
MEKDASMTGATLRPLRRADIAAAEKLQALCYPPPLRDSAEALRSRLDIPDHGCIAALIEDRLAGYILAHPWPSLCPPPVDAVLGAPPAAPRVHYIHDLSVDPAMRGTGLGRALVAVSQDAARQAGLDRSELIAVAGAAPFWRTLGYEAVFADEGLAAKVRAYGKDARYLARSL